MANSSLHKWRVLNNDEDAAIDAAEEPYDTLFEQRPSTLHKSAVGFPEFDININKPETVVAGVPLPKNKRKLDAVC